MFVPERGQSRKDAKSRRSGLLDQRMCGLRGVIVNGRGGSIQSLEFILYTKKARGTRREHRRGCPYSHSYGSRHSYRYLIPLTIDYKYTKIFWVKIKL